jgi:hypothetical protein
MGLLLLVILAGLCGAGCVVGAVYLLAGVGWSLLSAGLFLIAFAALGSRGLTANG